MLTKPFLDKYQKILNKKDFELFIKYCEKPLRKSIRVNTLKIGVKEFKLKAKKENWQLEQIPWCKEWFWIDRIDRSIPLWKSYLHIGWYFYIQEASSMIPPEILRPKPLEKILDISASPWSKTTQMAALMQNKWMIIANEIELKRLKTMKSNLDRLWVCNCLITQKDWMTFSQYFPNYFDKVLVDAPCTGEGTIRKDPKALNNWSEKAVTKLSKLQERLIIESFHSLKVWWELVYSTCTLSPEEDEYVIKNLLEKFKDESEIIPIKEKWITDKKNKFWLDWALRVWPQDFNTEWFFVAKIKKTKTTRSDYYSDIKPWNRKSPFKIIKKNTANPLYSMILNKRDNIDNIWKKWEEIWLRPKGSEEILSKIWCTNSWVIICTISKKWEIDFNHEWALVLSKLLKLDSYNLNKNQLEQYIKWFDLDYLQSKNSKLEYLVMTYNWLSIWLWKALSWKIKNKLPRYLVQNW